MDYNLTCISSANYAEHVTENNMTINKHVKLLLKITCILSFLETLLLILALNTVFEGDAGYFQRGAVLPYVILAIDILICIGALIPMFVKNKYPTEIDANGLTRRQANVYAILGTIAVLFGTLGICLNTQIVINSTIRLSLGVGLAGLGAFFLFLSYKDGYTYSKTKIINLIIAVVLPFAVMFETRSNFNRSFNSVENFASIVISISFIIYILNEGNRLAGASHPASRASANLLHVHFGTTFPLAYIVSYITGVVDDYVILTMMLIFLLTSFFALTSILKTLTPEQINNEDDESVIETPAENETSNAQETEDTIQSDK